MYQSAAKRRFKKAEWIHGDGRYALAATCGCLTVTLHETMEAAKKSKAQIDDTGCGHLCICRKGPVTDSNALSKAHEIVTLVEPGTMRSKDLELVYESVGYPLIDHAKLYRGRIESYAYGTDMSCFKKLNALCDEHGWDYFVTTGSEEEGHHNPEGCFRMCIFKKDEHPVYILY